MEATVKQFRKRNAILDCLRSSHEHPSAETVFQMVRAQQPDISLATVYRNLALFKQQGLIASVATVDGIERFDGNPLPHAHFICRCCGGVVDLPRLEMPDLAQQVNDTIGAAAESCQLSFTGVCSSCRVN